MGTLLGWFIDGEWRGESTNDCRDDGECSVKFDGRVADDPTNAAPPIEVVPMDELALAPPPPRPIPAALRGASPEAGSKAWIEAQEAMALLEAEAAKATAKRSGARAVAEKADEVLEAVVASLAVLTEAQRVAEAARDAKEADVALQAKLLRRARQAAALIAAVETARTMRADCTLEGHGGAVRSVVALRNNRVASCAYDKMVRVWRVGKSRGACIFKLSGHKDWCMQLIAVENGLLATASEDGTLRVWEAWGNRPKCIKVLGSGQVRRRVCV